ncbi:MAG: prepilin-type N-terminal cleavage/methylation domain-containing protein [Planctomycetaceae bacterium]|jgi:prepilin-type N-terminal cleavage/methylation domain-containing protein|nr:prepilin-type N-terminal cleavage/methylation domain-containing protein [Planctomycetaceae bacterium]
MLRKNSLSFGMTLIEMMIVLAIVVVLATLALSIANGPLLDIRLRKSADLIQTEWTKLRIKAMEDGHLYCFRSTLGGEKFQVDKILDVHFTAGVTDKNNASLNSERQRQIGTESLDYDDLTEEDFFLQSPQTNQKSTINKSQLPETCFFADSYVEPDVRAGYYTKMMTQGDGQGQIGYDGIYWSAPVFFYPDGTTSTATFLLKNDIGKCMEVHLRGLTGVTTKSSLSLPDNYRGSLNARNGRHSETREK